uniref:C2H2-type domain-containing protein n=1 Tax=Globodera pallida TaxID=36090 RepID=A0A183BNM2_GLOPA
MQRRIVCLTNGRIAHISRVGMTMSGVRDSEFFKRVCFDCGRVLIGAEKDYQEHLLTHESIQLLYQLDYFERFGPSAPSRFLLSGANHWTDQQQHKLHKPKTMEPIKKPQKRKQLLEASEEGSAKRNVT